MSEKLILIMLGAPGAGKGTYCAKLIGRYGTPQISTGEMLRAAIAEGNDLGKQVKADMDAGKLVPDSLVNEVVRERINKPDCEKGFILDGYPRAITQAESLETLLKEEGLAVSSVIHLDVPEEDLFKRLTGRRMCKGCDKGNFNVYTLPPKAEGVCDLCGGELYQRDDDNETTIKKRLATFNEQTAPLISFYKDKGVLKTIESGGSIDEMAERVFKAIDDK